MPKVQSSKSKVRSLVIVSACLAGVNCRYNGGSKSDPHIQKLVKEEIAVFVCPEQLGGLSVPRRPAEISGGSGEDVLDGKAKVIDKDGRDLASNFVKGAQEVLKIAEKIGVKKAILKSNSPSCGFGRVYDGTFKGRLRQGNGVTTALLLRAGVEVKSETSFGKERLFSGN